MKKIFVYLILIILTFSSLVIILIIGLDLQSCMIFGKSDYGENINNILLNLSYSYVAGSVFFLLVTFLPDLYRRKAVELAVAYKISQLYRKSESLLRYLNDRNIQSELDFINWTESKVEDFLSGKTLNDNLFCGTDIYEGTISDAMNVLKLEILNLIDSIMNYNTFMTEEQILLLTQISYSDFFLLLNFRNGDKLGRSFLDVDLAKFADFKKSFFELGVLIISLNKTINPKIARKLCISNEHTRVFAVEK